MAFAEHSQVRLLTPKEAPVDSINSTPGGYAAGTEGVVVDARAGGSYTVEVMDADGKTLALLECEANELAAVDE